MSFCLSTDPRKPACMLQSDVSLRTSVVHGGNELERCRVQLFPTYQCQQCGYLGSFSCGIALLVCIILSPLSLSLPTMELTHIVTCSLRLGCRPSKMFSINDSALHRHVLRGNEFTSRRYMRRLSLWTLGDTLKMDFWCVYTFLASRALNLRLIRSTMESSHISVTPRPGARSLLLL